MSDLGARKTVWVSTLEIDDGESESAVIGVWAEKPDRGELLTAVGGHLGLSDREQDALDAREVREEDEGRWLRWRSDPEKWEPRSIDHSIFTEELGVG